MRAEHPTPGTEAVNGRVEGPVKSGLTVAAVAAAVLIGQISACRGFGGGPGHHSVTGNWMRPNMPSQSWVKVEEDAYADVSEVGRGDVVVFRRPRRGGDISCAARVLGLPGDEVEADGTNVFVNLRRLEHTASGSNASSSFYTETLGNKTYRVQYESALGALQRIDRKVVVSPGELFVLGDNRD